MSLDSAKQLPHLRFRKFELEHCSPFLAMPSALFKAKAQWHLMSQWASCMFMRGSLTLAFDD
jgi:hypothetical protein